MSDGIARANHRYIARVPTGSGKYKYFYTTQELVAYKKSKSGVQKQLNDTDKPIGKEKKKKLKTSAVPTMSTPTAAVGKPIQGYKRGEKPKQYSDEEWERIQRLWGVGSKKKPIQVLGASARVRRKAKKSADSSPVKKAIKDLTISAIRKKANSKRKHSSGNF